ncbi:excinuclease ABC subunit UvrC [[Mycoplasma] testudinis]|uniref:excinuclease ABC subunit UvrC n=1 Tax=[Mycoplasma] testudinis TaxID=33924 RepID=UPI000488038F|nr:excinuclease ABC subunit UvrC [[Mycoplasma] testudinis]
MLPIHNQVLNHKLQNIPKAPGCYLWKNKFNQVIYVGKAKNLYNRTHQYFLKAADYKVSKLVAEIADVDFIVVKNENESLILEANLILKHQPHYNILLKNNNGYPYILVTNEIKPRLLYTREFKPKLGKYYGPFASAELKAYDIYKLLLKIFPLRKCANVQNKKCFYYDLHMCMGQCVNEDTPQKYAIVKKQIDDFFNKGAQSILKDLKAKEQAASNRLDFEQAKSYLELQNSINVIAKKQLINLVDKDNADYVAYDTKDNYVALVIFSYLDGKLLSKHSVVTKYIGTLNEQLTTYLYQYYCENYKPKTIYVSLDNENCDLLSKSLDVQLLNPQKGKPKQIMELALKNASNELQLKYSSTILREERTTKANQELSKLLKIPDLQRIEIFDNSNIFNVDRVAAMVVYENGIPNKKEYRKYKIQLQASRSDFDYMYEIIYRRYLRLLKEQKRFPDLIIVDGGLIQINAAKKALSQLMLVDKINLIGLVKDNHHKTRAIQLSDQSEIALDKTSSLYFFLLNMQEEVHRFAISFFRKTQRKSALTSIFDDIKNLGSIRRKKLLSVFDTINKIDEASIEQLAQIIPKAVAIELKQKVAKELTKEND